MKIQAKKMNIGGLKGEKIRQNVNKEHQNDLSKGKSHLA